MRIIKKLIALTTIFIMTFHCDSQGFTIQNTCCVVKADEMSSDRQQLNFNSDWKFVLGDAKGAEAVDYNDSIWGDVALPHSFSIPYDLNQNSFYIGYGWYRKVFHVDESMKGKRINLEFEGVFQTCTIYINGQLACFHEGGYIGFEVDITDYITFENNGRNVVAIQVDNNWKPDLAPRGGDHQFSGGIYRDVYLTITNPVHIDWYGDFIWTPALCNPKFQEGGGTVNILDSYVTDEELNHNIKNRQSDVQVITEITNESLEAVEIYTVHKVKDHANNEIAVFRSAAEIFQAGEGKSLVAQSEMISNIKLWAMNDPNLYSVETSVYANDVLVDKKESGFGFRSVQFTTDGFFLNGEQVMLDGVNVHQDHGGWCDAVTDSGFYRDVKMVKEAGFNFIRGSHYPHDPSFAQACDELGIGFWSEGGQWGIGGFKSNDEIYGTTTDWTHSAYPLDEQYEEKFQTSCMEMLESMVRMNRNHPSVLVWSMGNEAFFTDSSTIDKSKQLCSDMRDYCHKLDPTRKAGMGGTQRNGFNNISVCDVAGGNGDGATARYTNYELPHLVAEYASTQEERTNHTANLKWGNISSGEGSDITVNGETIKQYTAYKSGTYIDSSSGNGVFLQTGSSGMALWCMFHHGSVGGKNLRIMGIVDYYRVPLKAWYTYREVNTGVPREDSVEGTATRMKLETNFAREEQTTLENTGKDDVQIIVTFLNDHDEWVNESKDVTLEIVDGPGTFPGGKTYVMKDGKQFMDGKGAIEFRSFYGGTTTIQATAEGIEPVTLEITTEDVLGNHSEEQEPENFMGDVVIIDSTDKLPEPLVYGKNDAAYNRQTGETSSFQDDHKPLYAVDDDPDNYWKAGNTGSGEYWQISLENTYDLYKMKLDFDGKTYPYKIEVKAPLSDEWVLIKEYKTAEEVANRPNEETMKGFTTLEVRITFTDVPENEYAVLKNCKIYGVEHRNYPYQFDTVYLSDLEYAQLTNGWGTVTKDKSIEGNPITLSDGTIYKKGLGLHANSEAVYILNGKYTRFQAVIGIDAEVGNSYSAADATYKIFATYYDEVTGTNKEVQIFERTITGEDIAKVDLSVDQVTKLRLVTDKVSVNSNDHTDWADAKLLGALRDVTSDASILSGTFSSNYTAPKNGEDFQVNVRLENKTDDKVTDIIVVELYKDGQLYDSVESEMTLKKHGFDFTTLSIPVPETDNTYIVKAYVKNKDGDVVTDEVIYGDVILVQTIDDSYKLLGDMNSDKKLTAIDALYVLKNMDRVSTEFADVNGDQTVDIKDVLAILQAASKRK